MLMSIFNTLEIKIDWGFLFGLISVLSIFITWILTILNSDRKEIQVDDAFLERIITTPKNLEKTVKVTIDNKEVDSINQAKIYLLNSGNQVLNESDFYINPTINIKGYTNIINVSIKSSHEFTEISAIKKSESEIELTINNYEPKTYIVIDLIFESIESDYKPIFVVFLKGQKKISIDLSMININNEFSLSSDYNRVLTLSFLSAGFILGLTYLIARFGLGISFGDNFNYSVGWKVIFFAPSVIFGLFTAISALKKIGTWYSGWTKVKIWYKNSP